MKYVIISIIYTLLSANTAFAIGAPTRFEGFPEECTRTKLIEALKLAHSHLHSSTEFVTINAIYVHPTRRTK